MSSYAAEYHFRRSSRARHLRSLKSPKVVINWQELRRYSREIRA